MAREVYEKIDEIRDGVYGLVTMLRKLKDKETRELARYAYIELYSSFDTLAFLGGEDAGAGSPTTNRRSGFIEAGYAGAGLGGTKDVGSGGLPEAP